MVDNNLAALVAEYSRLASIDSLVDDEDSANAIAAILELAQYDDELSQWIEFIDGIHIIDGFTATDI